jgi:hypothetical protein
MAELELVGFDLAGKELEAPQAGDIYVAKRIVSFEQTIVTVDVNGRQVDIDGLKLDLMDVTLNVDIDALAARVAALDGASTIMGDWNPNSGTFPVSTITGETWNITGTAVLDSVQFYAGDQIVAIIDSASTVQYVGNWLHQQYASTVSSVAGKIGAVVLVENDVSDLQSYLLVTGIDTLAKLNAIVADATLTDAADQATAAQGALAISAVQPEGLDTLAKLNALVADATLDDVTGVRTPAAHTHGFADVTDMDLIDTTDARLSDVRVPTAHEHIPTLYTVATLPVGTVGQIAQVSDGDALLAYGDTVVNSGAGTTPYLVWYNSNDWTVIGE